MHAVVSISFVLSSKKGLFRKHRGDIKFGHSKQSNCFISLIMSSNVTDILYCRLLKDLMVILVLYKKLGKSHSSMLLPPVEHEKGAKTKCISFSLPLHRSEHLFGDQRRKHSQFDWGDFHHRQIRLWMLFLKHKSNNLILIAVIGM